MVGFIFAVNQQLACMSEFCPPRCTQGECTPAVHALAISWPKHLFPAEFFLGGGLVQDNHHDVGGTNHIPLKNIACVKM